MAPIMSAAGINTPRTPCTFLQNKILQFPEIEAVQPGTSPGMASQREIIRC